MCGITRKIRGYDTAILVGETGKVSEGPGFAVGFVIDKTIMCPKHNRLDSITIKALEKYCSENNIDFHWADIHPHDAILCYDGMFLASTAGKLIIVTKYEDREYDCKFLKNLVKKFNDN